jgi:hypothetical protein
VREAAPELLHLRVASHEAGEPASRRAVKPRTRRARRDELEDVQGVRQPLDGDAPLRGDVDVAFGEGQRRGRQQDRGRHRHLLHASGEMGRLPYRRIIHAQIGADRSDDDVARVEAHPDLDRHPVGLEDLARVAGEGGLHPERGIAGAHGVILMRDRRAEQRHDPIAHDLVHRALVPVHGFHHQLEHGVEDLPRLLGVAVGEQLHRTLEVGEEHRDLLALAFERGLRGEDPLGEVLGGIRLR